MDAPPELPIVNEPTVGLDPEKRLRFRHLLAGLDDHRLVILSTHSVSDVETSASGIAVMGQSRLPPAIALSLWRWPRVILA
ncbi:MAG TPA: hypothetical protein VF798_14750 [Burkholderiaceae bacterium]